MSAREKHLYYLNELKDYKVNSKDHDIRGWKIKDLDNRIIGKVDNLLVNKELGKVVYVDVEVDEGIIDKNHDPYSANPNSEVKEFINKEGENHIIIPIGLINLNLDDKYVYTESINYQTFAETKRYRSGTDISRDYEHHVLGSYERNNRSKNDDNWTGDEDLRRTRTAYTDDELKNRENRVSERTSERNDDRLHDDRSSTETEERIRREREHMTYESKKHNRPIDDHNRASHHHDTPRDLQPERTLDEDNNWTRDDRDLEDQDLPENTRKRNRDDENFYERNEFRNRNY